MIRKILASSSICIPLVLTFLMPLSTAGSDYDSAFHHEKGNPDILIQVESLISRLKEKPETIIVDVRDRADFEKIRIPGSLNIPLFALKTKAFLKSNDLILVNQGYKYEALENECLRLRENGFTAWILHGGLSAWRDENQSLEGRQMELKNLNKVSPRDLFSEKEYGSRLIINLSGIENSGDAALIPHSISIPFDNEKNFFIKFMDLLKRSKDSYPLSILIFNEKGDQYQKAEKVIQRTGAKNVFYLKGGLESYKKYYEQQAMIGKAELARNTEINECGTCP